MGSVLNSFDTLIASSSANGPLLRSYYSRLSATTAANITSGYVTAQRYPSPLIMPASFGTGITGAVFPYIRMVNEDGNTAIVCGIEYNLGTLTISGNTFADGVAMPTKTIRGSSIVTATQMAFLQVSANLTATTPVITITYTDQSGNTGNTATMTLPTNATLNSAFNITPHLANGDTGIRDITNMSTDVGTAGSLVVRGLLVLNVSNNSTGAMCGSQDPLTVPHLMWKAEASENIAFYRLGNTAASNIIAVLNGVADN